MPISYNPYQTTYQASYQKPTISSQNKSIQFSIKPAKTIVPKVIKKPAMDYQQPQQTTIKKDLSDAIANFGLEQGPHNKTAETYTIEKIVREMLAPKSNIAIHYNLQLKEFEIVNTQFKKPISLNALLKRANLSHLDFDAETITQFYQLIKHQYAVHLDPYHPLSSFYKDLPGWICSVLTYYSYNFTCNIMANLPHDKITEPKLNFLILCFANFALKQLSLHYSDKIYELKNKKHLTPNEMQILAYHAKTHSKNGMKRSDAMDWFKFSDSKNPTILQANSLVSISYDSKASNLTLKNTPDYLPSIEVLSPYKIEKEIILPAGTQYIIQKTNSNYFELTVINTPMPAFQFSMRVADALRYAFLNYLNKPFSNEKPISNTVYRPNYNIVHTMRQVFYVQPIVDYFAAHGNESLAGFCKTMTEETRDMIQLALTFSVTGRKSEIAFADNPGEYFTYRQASAQHFIAYTKSIGIDDHLIQRYARLVLYMGNPNFPATINHPTSSDYNLEDNFIFYIITMAHKLDLPRCYTAAMYLNSLQPYKIAPIIQTTPEALAHFETLTQYALNCIITTGDMVSSGFNYPSQHYQGVFKEASLSPLKCENLLCQVPSPKVIERLKNNVTLNKNNFFAKPLTIVKDNESFTSVMGIPSIKKY